MDYAACQGFSPLNMGGLLRPLLIYDIMCQWWVYFWERLEESEYLELLPGLIILKAIGDFHKKDHVKPCTPRFGLTFHEGVGIIDGEIIETLWSVLNQTSRSTRGATLAHRTEILDDHMNHSNWKKLVGICESLDTVLDNPYKSTMGIIIAATLIRKWNRALQIFAEAEEAFNDLSQNADPACLIEWNTGAERAQRDQHTDITAMDYFLFKSFLAPGRAHMKLQLTEKEQKDQNSGLNSMTAFLVEGLKIQETQ